MAAAGAEGRTMRRELGEPAGRTREDARGGLPSFTRASLAPPAGHPIDEHPFQEHRRARRRRLSGESRLITLKGNQKKAHAEVKGWFASNAFALGASLRPCFDAFDDGHGRLVRRRVFACTDLGPFAALEDWPGLAAVVAVETIRGIPGRGKVTAEIRHYLSSARLPPAALAAAIRNHWRIENGLHWVLDVGFREDASRVRERNAARNLALLRRIALNFARADGSLKTSLKGKRKYAGWDDAFMAALIAG
jgi:predicted transposase YbfD/YdcC